MDEAEVLQAVRSVKVEEDRQGELVVVECVPPNHTQPVQRQPLKPIDGDEDVAGHLSDALQGQRRDRQDMTQQNKSLKAGAFNRSLEPAGEVHGTGVGINGVVSERCFVLRNPNASQECG